MSNNRHIALIPKNQREQIRIGLDEFNDHHYADIRIVAEGPEQKLTYTRKGVSIPLRRLPAVIDALQTALNEARDRGLFGKDAA